jgi:Matrixin
MYLLLTAFLLSAPQPARCIAPPFGTGEGQTKPFVCAAARASKDSRGTNPVSLNWPGRSMTFRLNAAGSPDIAGDTELETLRAAFRSWNEVSESSFTFIDGGVTDSEAVGYNYRRPEANLNLVLFQQVWPHPDQTSAVALTTSTYNVITGEIFDSDIEINDEFVFTVGDEGVQIDLLGAITHEAGHALGLDHPQKSTAIDPECQDSSTMSNTTSTGETSKRVLAGTDVMGVRFIYPAGSAQNGFCSPPGEAPPRVKISQVSSTLRHGCGNYGPFPLGPTAFMVAFRHRRARKKAEWAQAAHASKPVVRA